MPSSASGSAVTKVLENVRSAELECPCGASDGQHPLCAQNRIYGSYLGKHSEDISPRVGAARSFSESKGVSTGHSIPISGSFQSTEASAFALYLAVHL